MARINVEQKALTDSRYRRLGRQMLEAMPTKEVEHALGLYLAILVWNHCQETERYVLPDDEIDGYEPYLAEAMQYAKLAVKYKGGQSRVCGTRGRIEWLKQRRKEGRAGGKKGGRPRKSTETHRGLPENTPLTPAPAPAPAPTEEKEKTLIPSPAAAADAGGGSDSVKPKTRKRTKPTAPYSAEFLEFWAAYPRKIGKGAAWKVWKQRKDRPKNGDMLASVEAHKRSEQWTKDGGQYIPHPATFLNQARWEDEPDSANREVWI